MSQSRFRKLSDSALCVSVDGVSSHRAWNTLEFWSQRDLTSTDSMNIGTSPGGSELEQAKRRSYGSAFQYQLARRTDSALLAIE